LIHPRGRCGSGFHSPARPRGKPPESPGSLAHRQPPSPKTSVSTAFAPACSFVPIHSLPSDIAPRKPDISTLTCANLPPQRLPRRMPRLTSTLGGTRLQAPPRGGGSMLAPGPRPSVGIPARDSRTAEHRVEESLRGDRHVIESPPRKIVFLRNARVGGSPRGRWRRQRFRNRVCFPKIERLREGATQAARFQRPTSLHSARYRNPLYFSPASCMAGCCGSSRITNCMKSPRSSLPAS